MRERGLWLTLAAILFVRLASPFVPGSWLWGWDALRDAPVLAWIALAAGIILLIPPFARRVSGALDAPLTRVLDARAGFLPFLLAGAVVVWWLPDRVYFVGDFLLRQTAIEQGGPASVLFPQYLPLDRWLHHDLPAFAVAQWGVEASTWNRGFGAVGAGLLAAVAVSAPRWLGVRGVAGLALAGLLFWGGWLALFTGLAKGFSELVLLTAATGSLGLRAVREGRGRVALTLLLVVALLTHRAALALVPAAYWALAVSPQAGRRRAWLETALWIAPVAALVWVAPKLIETLGGIDRANFGLAAESAPLLSLLAPIRLLDLTNLLVLLIPCIAVAWLGFRRPDALEERTDRASERVARRERVYWGIWLLPQLALLLLYRPPQGLFRDFDGLAAAAMAIAVFVAVRLSEYFARSTPAREAVPALLWLTIVPTVLWLWVHTDLDRGLARAERLAAGPPPRSESVRAHTWDFIGSRYYREDRFAESAQALERAVTLAPSPRLIAGWADAAKNARDWEQTDRAYALLLERAPESPVAYRVTAHVGLGANAGRRGDLSTARRHLEAALQLAPGHGEARRLLTQVEQLERIERTRQNESPSNGRVESRPESR